MKNMTKRVLSLLLCIVLCVTMLPGYARAAEGTVPQAAARVRGSRLTDVPVSCGTYQYQPRAAGLTPMEGKLADANLNKAWRSGGQLDEAAQGLYGAVLDLAAQNAAGTLASTTYVFTDDDSWVYDCLYWSADMLGVDQIVDNNGNITKAAKEAASALFGDCVDDAFDALLADNPYEFYWQDKTRSSSFSFSCSCYQSDEDGSYWLGITDITMPVAVSQDYAAQNADGTYQTSELDTVKCAVTHQAIVKADAIVAAHAGESDFEKLQSYRDEICALTDYNDAAADASNNTPYGDPWQLIYVFDNDPDTKVVCEGYSKAFQLLCDRTEFDQAIDCITVSGTMSGGTGSGGHMWNVVTMEDGKHYIVDVTNCDAGTVGYPNLLFLSGAADGGSVNSGYQFDCNGTPITYTYNATTRFLFAEAELTLSTTAYTPAAAEGIAVDEINFPDDAFRSYVSTHCDTDTNGWLSETEIDNVTLIAVNNDTEIRSLKGVEFFTALRQLHCANTSLTELDVRRNTALERLYCDSNQLTELDVSQNTALTNLHCSINQLKALNVSNNTALKGLYVTGNQLTELDVSNNEALTSLECSSNPLTTLDVSHNPNLKLLHCGGTGLTELDVSHNSQLEQLWMQVTGISSIDLSANTALKILCCESTNLETLDISACPKLVDVVTNGERLVNNGVLTYRILENNIAQELLKLDESVTLITEAVPTAKIYGCTLSLDGDIGVNFYVVLPDEFINDPDAYITLNTTRLTLADAKASTMEGQQVYKWKYRVAAKRMADEVVLNVYNGAGEKLKLESFSTGEDFSESGYSYSVRKYIEQTVASSSNAKLLALVKAMSDYGSKAQAQFKYNASTAAAIYDQAAIDAVTAETVEPYRYTKTESEQPGLSFMALTLVLESETTLKLYFKLNEGVIGDYSFTLDGKAVTPTYSKGYYVVEMKNIAAKNLDKVYTVTVSDGSGVILTVNSCALSYAYQVLSRTDQSEELVQLVKALYLYNQAANAYFEN